MAERGLLLRFQTYDDLLDHLDALRETMVGEQERLPSGVPKLLEMVRSGMIHPATILTQQIALDGVIDAYKAFDRREPGWTKVEIRSAA